MNEEELKILRTLDLAVRSGPATRVIDTIMRRVEQKMVYVPEVSVFGEPVPLATYGQMLPEAIRSSWVFILRAQTNSGAERHPNSHQRAMSYRGSGDLQVWNGNEWRSHLLISDTDLKIEKRWVSIPSNTWHQAIIPEDNWVVVSFHTVTEDALIEERPDPTDTNLMHQRRYLSEQHAKLS